MQKTECKNEILIEKDFATCNNYDNFTVRSFFINDNKVRCVFQSDVTERFTIMIPLFLLQEITKQSVDKKCIFLQSLMAQHVTVQYDPNDLVAKLLANIEE